MRRTDLLIVCPAKFGGWMIKNPAIVEIGHEQNGVTIIEMRNSANWTVEFFTKDPDDALECLAELIAEETGRVSLETSAMRDLIVPRAAYFGNEDDDDE